MQDAGYHPRYANYARFHGRRPSDQAEQDKKEHPSAPLTGFIAWNQGMLQVFSRVKPQAFKDKELVDPDTYDLWLTLQVDEINRAHGRAKEIYA